MDKLMEELSKWAVPVYVFLLSIWSGTVYTINRVKKGELKNFSVREWVGDIVISSFIGILTYLLCKYFKVDEILSSVFIAVAAHMGTRALALAEEAFTIVIFRKFGIKDNDDSTNSKK